MCDSQDLEESQSHLLVCATMIEECTELRKNRTVKYEDFFGDRDAQIAAVHLYKKVMEVRQRLFEEREDSYPTGSKAPNKLSAVEISLFGCNK